MTSTQEVREAVPRSGSSSRRPRCYGDSPASLFLPAGGDEAELGGETELIHTPTPGSRRRETPLALLRRPQLYPHPLVCFILPVAESVDTKAGG